MLPFFFDIQAFFKFATVTLLSLWIVLLLPSRNRLNNQSEHPEGRPWMSSHGQHAFLAPGQGDVRSPCPALNTLANHGYINRSGKGISASSLIDSLTSIYHLSLPLATTLVAGGFLSCSNGDIGEGISLHALAAHNKIEHDASLVHDDALLGAKFAPTQVNQTLINDLFHTYPDGLGIDDLAEARWSREMMLPQEKKPKLNMIHEEIGHGEAALTWLLMKDNRGVVKPKTLRQWYGVETFPETYVIPTEEISLEMARTVSAEIGRIMKRHS